MSGSLSASNSFTLAVVTNLPASAIQPTAAMLAGQVLSNGGFAPAITLYYGSANGGTNAGSWANSIVLGVETGAFSQPVSGLSPYTTYYYSVRAVNYAGTAWASPVESFTTGGVTVPQVTNGPATAIGASLATLNGQVLSTGGATTSVILYYGLADGGTNAGSWSQSVAIGAQSGSFSQTIGRVVFQHDLLFTGLANRPQFWMRCLSRCHQNSYLPRSRQIRLPPSSRFSPITMTTHAGEQIPTKPF